MPVELFEVIHKDIDIVTVAVQMDEEGWEERFAAQFKEKYNGLYNQNILTFHVKLRASELLECLSRLTSALRLELGR